jgi:transposase InsO family protein
VVMDNLSVHKSRYVRELIERRGCELWFLAAYSPDLNPIEEAFSKAKGILKKAKARSLQALFEATARALSAVGEEASREASSATAATPQPRITDYENRFNGEAIGPCLAFSDTFLERVW